MDRREFLKVGAQTGLVAAAAACAPAVAAAPDRPAPGIVTGQGSDIVVIGAGAFGGWTALHLQRMGHRVTMVDAYGPGNSRSTSGDETRGIRTGYGDRELWSAWAKQAIELWKQWDREWGSQMFTTTGDLAMRPELDGFLRDTMATWEKVGIRHQLLSHDEIAARFPQINIEGIGIGLYEPDAGVARARYACQVVADQFQKLGGRIVIGHAEMGSSTGRRLDNVTLRPGERLTADTYVWALGPWFPKAFPQLIGDRIRIPLGHVYYFGVPAGDHRFTAPNMPSYAFPGVTGWPTLAHDSRGFRVRTGGRPPEDPDVSVRWIDEQYHAAARKVLQDRFPALADAPLIETRACHYEQSVSRNFILDRHPDFGNVWIAGGGSAEGFKFGPMVGDYMAKRVTGQINDPALEEAFRLPTEA